VTGVEVIRRLQQNQEQRQRLGGEAPPRGKGVADLNGENGV
jgi:hypothetical protein